jgi:hypothetical protein
MRRIVMPEEKKEGKFSKFLKLFEPKKSSCCCMKIEEVIDEKEKPGEKKNNKKCGS